MSDHAAKFERAVETHGTAAECSLEQLRDQHGFKRLDEDNAVTSDMGKPLYWARVSGNGLKSRWRKLTQIPEGDSRAVFEGGP